MAGVSELHDDYPRPALLPWRAIPELADVEPLRAQRVFHRAAERAARSWGMGALLAAFAVGTGGVIAAGVALQQAFAWLALAGTLVVALCCGVAVAALPVLFARYQRPLLRRAVRAELGTHCAACDYDLRGLASARCPECGGAIARGGRDRGEDEEGG